METIIFFIILFLSIIAINWKVKRDRRKEMDNLFTMLRKENFNIIGYPTNDNDEYRTEWFSGKHMKISKNDIEFKITEEQDSTFIGSRMYYHIDSPLHRDNSINLTITLKGAKEKKFEIRTPDPKLSDFILERIETLKIKEVLEDGEMIHIYFGRMNHNCKRDNKALLRSLEAYLELARILNRYVKRLDIID